MVPIPGGVIGAAAKKRESIRCPADDHSISLTPVKRTNHLTSCDLVKDYNKTIWFKRFKSEFSTLTAGGG
jgi:hypothetical protein